MIKNHLIESSKKHKNIYQITRGITNCNNISNTVRNTYSSRLRAVTAYLRLPTNRNEVNGCKFVLTKFFILGS